MSNCSDLTVRKRVGRAGKTGQRIFIVSIFAVSSQMINQFEVVDISTRSAASYFTGKNRRIREYAADCGCGVIVVAEIIILGSIKGFRSVIACDIRQFLQILPIKTQAFTGNNGEVFDKVRERYYMFLMSGCYFIHCCIRLFSVL